MAARTPLCLSLPLKYSPGARWCIKSPAPYSSGFTRIPNAWSGPTFNVSLILYKKYQGFFLKKSSRQYNKSLRLPMYSYFFRRFLRKYSRIMNLSQLWLTSLSKIIYPFGNNFTGFLLLCFMLPFHCGFNH